LAQRVNRFLSTNTAQKVLACGLGDVVEFLQKIVIARTRNLDKASEKFLAGIHHPWSVYFFCESTVGGLSSIAAASQICLDVLVLVFHEMSSEPVFVILTAVLEAIDTEKGKKRLWVDSGRLITIVGMILVGILLSFF
jgi:hypothetical protein